MKKNEFGQDWKLILEDIISLGRASGADIVEIFLERTDNFGVLAEQDSITSVNPSFSKGAGIRVFKSGKDGFISTNDLSKKGLYQAISQALGMLGLETLSSGMFS